MPSSQESVAFLSPLPSHTLRFLSLTWSNHKSGYLTKFSLKDITLKKVNIGLPVIRNILIKGTVEKSCQEVTQLSLLLLPGCYLNQGTQIQMPTVVKKE